MRATLEFLATLCYAVEHPAHIVLPWRA